MGYGIVYTKEEKDFVKEFAPGHSMQEVADEFSKRFRKVTRDQIQSRMHHWGIKTGRDTRFKKGHHTWNKGVPFISGGRSEETRFKKGHKPHNTKPIGYESIRKDGYVWVKVCDGVPSHKNFKMKHILLWEQVYGPVPKGSVVAFLDGDVQNFDIDNLILLSRQEHLELTRQKLRFDEKELTLSGVAVTKLILAIKDRKKQLRSDKT